MKLSKGLLPPRQWCVGLSSLVALAVFLVFGPDSRVGFVAPGEAARELPPAAASQLPLMKAVSTPRPQPRLVQSYGKLPLSFEANQGQTDSEVKFLSRGRGYTLFLTGNEAVLSLRQPSAVSNQPSVGVRSSKFENRNSPAGTLLSGISNLPSLLSSSQSLAPSAEPPAPSVVRLKLVGANPKARVTGLDSLPGKSNYFIGNDPKKWRTNVANYAKVKYEGVYPGVDVVYYGNQGRLEYDFIVAPGADPSAIRLAVDAPVVASLYERRDPNGGHRPPLQIAANGDLVIQTDAGEVRFHKPVVYQPSPSPESRVPSSGSSNPKSQIQNRKSVDGRYTLLANNQIAFEVPQYDRTLPLIIDPVLIYSTYLGGTGNDYANGIAVDSSGNAYVTGRTSSLDFPTQNSLQGNNADGYDAFVTKLSAAGDATVYSTYLGGSGGDNAYAIAVDSSGNAYVTGVTSSTDFPTLNPVQARYRGSNDGFVTKLNATGNALVYSTFLGGSREGDHYGSDCGSGIAVDSSGNAYVTGCTSSAHFPTVNPIQAAPGGYGDVFVAKLNATGSGLVYSTYLGGRDHDYGRSIAVDSSGNACITGYTRARDFPTLNPIQAAHGGGDYDAFVAKLNAEGSSLVYSTYLGGRATDVGTGVAVDSSDSVYVTGYAYSRNFPTQNPLQGSNAGPHDAFVAKLNAAGDALLYSTYLGGALDEQAAGIALDSSDNVYVTGYTFSTDFPTQHPLQESKAGDSDAFVAEFNPAGSALLQSTYLGGTGGDQGSGIAVDGSGHVYLTGSTSSTDFPTLNPLQPAFAGAFVAKLSLVPVPGMSLSPSRLDFGSQPVGTTSVAQTMTITNIGELPLNITSITASGDFDVAAASAPCWTGGELDPGLSCGMSVTFTPTATGARTGAISIVSNAPASPYNAALSGTGTDFAVAAQSGETTSATVDAGATATFNLQLVPTGFSGEVALACTEDIAEATCSVSPNSVAVNGVDPAPFTVNVTTTARGVIGPTLHEVPPALGRYRGQPVLLWSLVLAMLFILAARSRRVGGQLCATTLTSRRPEGLRYTLARRRAAWGLAVTMLSVVLWAGCGGEAGPTPQVGTPAGTYTLTVMATSGSLSRSIELTLQVF